MEKAVSALTPAERVTLLGLLRKLGRSAEEALDDSPGGKRRPVKTKND
jgi:hypothetical protein